MGKIINFRRVSWAVYSLATAALAACGGGSSSSDPIDKYIGTWTASECRTDDSNVTQTVSGTQKNTNSKETKYISKTNSTVANIKYVTNYYAFNDTQCSGTPIYSITTTGENTGASSVGDAATSTGLGKNTLTIAKTVTVEGFEAEQVDMVYAAQFPTNIGGNSKSVANGIVIDTTSQTGYSSKYLIKISGDTMTKVYDFNGTDYATTFKSSNSVDIQTFTRSK